jgi:hypothetical protein
LTARTQNTHTEKKLQTRVDTMMTRIWGWRELVALPLLGLFLAAAALVVLNWEGPAPGARAYF